jgi:D-arabinitol 4-dehydrogenase
MLPALFLAFLQRWHAGHLPFDYQDRAMNPALARAICQAADPAAAFGADAHLWGALAGDAQVLAALQVAAPRVKAFTPSC